MTIPIIEGAKLVALAILGYFGYKILDKTDIIGKAEKGMEAVKGAIETAASAPGKVYKLVSERLFSGEYCEFMYPRTKIFLDEMETLIQSSWQNYIDKKPITMNKMDVTSFDNIYKLSRGNLSLPKPMASISNFNDEKILKSGLTMSDETRIIVSKGILDIFRKEIK